MNQYVKEIVRELFSNPHINTIMTRNNVYYRDVIRDRDVVRICVMDRYLFERLGKDQYYADKVLARMEYDEWIDLIKN